MDAMLGATTSHPPRVVIPKLLLSQKTKPDRFKRTEAAAAPLGLSRTMEEEEDDFYATNGTSTVPKQEQVDGDEGDDNQSEQMDEDEEDNDEEEESDSVREL